LESESNWRANVSEYGMWGAGFSLIASVPSTGQVIARPIGPPWPGQYATLINFDPDRGWEVDGYHGVPAGHPHFPFGLPAEPD